MLQSDIEKSFMTFIQKKIQIYALYYSYNKLMFQPNLKDDLAHVAQKNVVVMELPCGAGKSTSFVVMCNLLQIRIQPKIIYICVPNEFLKDQMEIQLNNIGVNLEGKDGMGSVQIKLPKELLKLDKTDIEESIVLIDELHCFFQCKLREAG